MTNQSDSTQNSGEVLRQELAAAQSTIEAQAREIGELREGKWITRLIREVAELPDRDSPEDWPEAMLVTGAELEAIVRALISSTGEPKA